MFRQSRGRSQSYNSQSVSDRDANGQTQQWQRISSFSIRPLNGNSFTEPRLVSRLTDAQVLEQYGFPRQQFPRQSLRRHRSRSAPITYHHHLDGASSQAQPQGQSFSRNLQTFSIFRNNSPTGRRYAVVKHEVDQTNVTNTGQGSSAIDNYFVPAA